MFNYYSSSHYQYLNDKPMCALFSEVVQIP